MQNNVELSSQVAVPPHRQRRVSAALLFISIKMRDNKFLVSNHSKRQKNRLSGYELFLQLNEKKDNLAEKK